MFSCEENKPLTFRDKLATGRFVRVAISDRAGCTRSLVDQVARLSGCIDALILRERDLDELAYASLAREVFARCRLATIEGIVHTKTEVAQQVGCTVVHLPLPKLVRQGRPPLCELVGTNVHTIEDIKQAQQLGADYLIACPLFAPSCKPTVRPQGLAFLQRVVETSRLPVLALGGINDTNEYLVEATGAAGACRMADFMQK